MGLDGRDEARVYVTESVIRFEYLVPADRHYVRLACLVTDNRRGWYEYVGRGVLRVRGVKGMLDVAVAVAVAASVRPNK